MLYFVYWGIYFGKYGKILGKMVGNEFIFVLSTFQETIEATCLPWARTLECKLLSHFINDNFLVTFFRLQNVLHSDKTHLRSLTKSALPSLLHCRLVLICCCLGNVLSHASSADVDWRRKTTGK